MAIYENNVFTCLEHHGVWRNILHTYNCAPIRMVWKYGLTTLENIYLVINQIYGPMIKFIVRKKVREIKFCSSYKVFKAWSNT